MSTSEIRHSIQNRIAANESDAMLDTPNSIGIIPLIFAAEQNDVDLTHRLIAFRANVNVQDSQGATPLFHALRSGNTSIAHFLIDHGAQADIQDAHGNTPRSLAQEYSLSDISKRFGESTNTEKQRSKGKEKKESPKKPTKLASLKKKAQTAFQVLHVLNTRKSTTEIQRKLLAIFVDKKTMVTASSEKKLHVTSGDWYALITAVSQNNAEKVTEVLRDENANVNLVTPSGFTALSLACSNGNIEIVKQLLQHQKTIVDLPIQSGATPLITAISTLTNTLQRQKKCFKIVKLLVEHGANIDAQDKEGSSALMKALLNGNIEVATFLIKVGADTSLKDKHGFGALFYASGKGYATIVKKLIKHGTKVDNTSKQWFPLTQAVSEEHYEIAKLLHKEANELIKEIEENQEKKAQEILGQNNEEKPDPSFWQRVKNKIIESKPVTKTMLFAKNQGALKAWLEIAKSKLKYIHEEDIENAIAISNTLLSRSFEQTNEWYWITPHIMDKIMEDNDGIIKTLITWLIAKNKNLASSPLLAALIRNETKVAQWLIEAGTDLDTCNSNGFTPLMLAAKKKNFKVAQLLVEAGADVNKGSYEGTTPLMIAITKKQDKIVQLLIEAGADVNTRDNNGHAPLVSAVGLNQLDFAKLLIQAKANVNVNIPHKGGPYPLLQFVTQKSELLGILQCILENNPNLSIETKTKIRVWAVQSNNLKAIDILDEYDCNPYSFHKIEKEATTQESNNQRKNIVNIIEQSTNKSVNLAELVNVLSQYNLLTEEALDDIHEVIDQKKSNSRRNASPAQILIARQENLHIQNLLESVYSNQPHTKANFDDLITSFNEIKELLDYPELTQENLLAIEQIQKNVKSRILNMKKQLGIVPCSPGGFPLT